MKISKQHLKKGSKKRSGKKINPKFITIHSTANPRSTAQNERDYLSNPINTYFTGWHYVVGENIIIEAIPPNERAYHAGHKKGNNESIGIEMVETGNRSKVINNTIKLTKHLQKKFNIKNKNVVRHYDWTKKNCPRILNTNGNWEEWVYFKTKLRKGDVKKMTDKQVRKIVKEEIEKLNNGMLGINSSVSNWAKDFWEEGKKLNITDGSRPKGFATREEVVTLILRTLNKFDK